MPARNYAKSLSPAGKNVAYFPTHLRTCRETPYTLGQAVTFSEKRQTWAYIEHMGYSRRIAAIALSAVLLTAPLGCEAGWYKADTMAERTATVFDLSVTALNLLDAMVTTYLDAPDAIPAEQLKALTDATYDLMLARVNLEDATDGYREGDYEASLKSIKLAVGYMRDCVAQLKTVGANLKVVESVLRELDAALP